MTCQRCEAYDREIQKMKEELELLREEYRYHLSQSYLLREKVEAALKLNKDLYEDVKETLKRLAI